MAVLGALSSRVVEQWLSSGARDARVPGNSALAIKRGVVISGLRELRVWGSGNPRLLYPGGAFGKGCCELAGGGVVVGVDSGGGLAEIGAQDPPGVLD